MLKSAQSRWPSWRYALKEMAGQNTNSTTSSLLQFLVVNNHQHFWRECREAGRWNLLFAAKRRYRTSRTQLSVCSRRFEVNLTVLVLEWLIGIKLFMFYWISIEYRYSKDGLVVYRTPQIGTGSLNSLIYYFLTDYLSSAYKCSCANWIMWTNSKYRIEANVDREW